MEVAEAVVGDGAEALGAALYRVPAIRSARKPPEAALKSFGFAVANKADKAAAERGLEHGRAIAAGTALELWRERSRR